MSMTDATLVATQRGFTLIELVVFIVIVGVGLAGILSVVDAAVKSSADPLVRKQALVIAEALLEEIMLKDYSNPLDGYAGSSRAEFDDVDDYAGYGTSAGILDLEGMPIAAMGSYNISPVVTVVPMAALAGVVVAKKITVSVTGPGTVVSLSGYRGNY